MAVERGGERGDNDFSRVFSDAVDARRLTLRALQSRLRDRGYEISLAGLSLWKSGARQPTRDTSRDVLGELEQILQLDDGALTAVVRPPRRVPEDRNRTWGELIGVDLDDFLAEPPERELLERAGALGYFLDEEGRIVRTENRTLWQARMDGATSVIVFEGIDVDDERPPELVGGVGCTIDDIAVDPERGLMRGTLKLLSPMYRGELTIGERITHRYVTDDTLSDFDCGVTAPRRQSELVLYVVFHPDRLPISCYVNVEVDGRSTSHRLTLNGNVATHAEFNFGPGSIGMDWQW